MTDNVIEEQAELAGDSSVIKVLRDKVRTLEGELKARPHYEDVEAEVERRVSRTSAATDALVRRGYSPNMVKLLTREVEGDITDESVDAFLEGLGLPKSSQPTHDKAKDIGKVASLASRVATAASPGGPERTVATELGQASNIADIDRIMREAGLAE